MAKHDPIDVKVNIARDVTPALSAEILTRGLDLDESDNAKTTRALKRLAGLD